MMISSKGALLSSFSHKTSTVAPHGIHCRSRAPVAGLHHQYEVLTRASNLDLSKLSESLMSSDDMEPEKRFALERLSAVLDVPLGVVKNMVFKRKGLVALTPEDVSSRIKQLAGILEVAEDLARQMVVIQPGLLFDTEKQAETLKYGIRAICFELEASKDEVVDLILKNQSVLHGRELRLSVADMAHLAMLREPRGRIVD